MKAPASECEASIPNHFVILLILLIPLSFAVAQTVDPLDLWHWRNPLPQGNTLRAIAHANGVSVIVGNAGMILSSADGTNFSRSSVFTSASLYGVTFGGGIFVVVGDAGTILSSSNGRDWSVQLSGTDSLIRRVTWGNGAFWAASDSGTILKSTNGIAWESQPVSSAALWSVRYLNGFYFAVGDAGIFRSSNGMEWALVSTRRPIRDIGYGNGGFVAVGSVTGSGFILVSLCQQWHLKREGSLLLEWAARA